MYALLFLVGFFGFVGMAGMSFLHSGHDCHTGNHGSRGEAIGSLKAIQHAGSRAPSGHARLGTAKVAKARFRSWWAISPFDILAYCTGAGAAGETMRQLGQEPRLTVAAAILGALVFNFGLAKPVLALLLRFESPQSAGLEGQIAQRGEAATRFDAEGRGLVRLALDGQIVQVLGILDREEREKGVTVLKGDPLVIVDVDPARNTCRVTRELAS